jgi:hypothetical protein
LLAVMAAVMFSASGLSPGEPDAQTAAPTARFTVVDLQDGILHVESNLGCLRQ